jgi:hypothetical protein
MNIEIQMWDTNKGEWWRYGIYLDMPHALQNLDYLKNLELARFRINPETVPVGWFYDDPYDKWIKT